MKAYVLQDIGDIKLKDVPEPVPQDNEVLIRVRACGICGSDIPRIYKDGAHKMPLIPGHEFAGEVAAVGRNVDKRLLHKRVGVFPLIPCRKCAACRKGQYELCRNYGYLGSRRDGGFAEYVAVPAANLMELPDSVSFEAAAMLEPMAVAVHAMRRIWPCMGLPDRKKERSLPHAERAEAGRNPHVRDKIAVCGLGTIGLLLVMFLKEAGFENVFVIGNKDFQKETLQKTGIPKEHFFDCRKGDAGQWILERTDGAGADVFFECVGKNETVSQAINLTALAGKVCLVGNPFADIEIPKDIYWKILRNQLTVTGTWNSVFTKDTEDDWCYVMERLTDHRIEPEKLISHRLLLEKLGEGFQMMRDRTEEYIKIMGYPK